MSMPCYRSDAPVLVPIPPPVAVEAWAVKHDATAMGVHFRQTRAAEAVHLRDRYETETLLDVAGPGLQIRDDSGRDVDGGGFDEALELGAGIDLDYLQAHFCFDQIDAEYLSPYCVRRRQRDSLDL